MPEGAEVRVISEGLTRLVGSRICKNITPVSGRYTKKPIPGIDLFSSSKVTGIGVKGKLIFWILSNETFILNTLGMTGTWSLDGGHKHARVMFEFTEGEPVYFVDMRNFGTIKVIKGKNDFLKKLQSLGPDMLNEDVTDLEFAESLDKKPHWSIAKALMHQSVVCGVGNYVKAEALYRAKLSPWRLVGSLSTSEISNLNASVKSVLRQAYADQGATIATYKNVEGEEGYASLQFMVYGKKNDPHNNQVLREKTDDGRTTHWVPSVQN